MISRFFGQSRPLQIMVVIILLAVGFAVAWLFLFSSNQSPHIILISLSFAALIFSFLLMDFILERNKLSKGSSYALLIMVCLLCCYPKILLDPKLLLSHLFLLISYRRILSLYSQKRVKAKLFDAGFWIGVSGILLGWAFAFFLTIYVAIVLFEVVESKNLAVPAIGLGIFLFLYSTYLYLTDQLGDFINSFEMPLRLETAKYEDPFFLFPSILLLTIGTSCLIFYIRSIVKKGAGQSRKRWVVVVALLAIAISFLTDTSKGSEQIFLLFPASIVMGYTAESIKRIWLREVLLFIIILCPIAIYSLHFWPKS